MGSKHTKRFFTPLLFAVVAGCGTTTTTTYEGDGNPSNGGDGDGENPGGDGDGQDPDGDGDGQDPGGDGDGQDPGGDGDGMPGVDPDDLNPPGNGAVDTTPVVCGSTSDAGGFTFEKIATWRDDAKSAYSMIHDDLCGSTLRGIDQLAVPALLMRGLAAGVGPYVNACEDFGLWNVVTEAAEQGNEIINHSYTHANISVENAPMEVVAAKQKIEEGSGAELSFYIFPYDYFTPQTLQAVGNAGHIGARGGSRDDNDGSTNPPINTAEPGKDLEVEFDVWPRTYSKYASYYPKDVLLVHAHNAIERGGWAVREFHSVSSDENPPEDGTQGFGPVPLRVYEEHLDDLVTGWKTNDVWTAPPSTVIRYRHARKACTASLSGNTISFGTPNAECTKYATPISVIVTTGNDVNSIEATQGGTQLYTRKIGPSTFSINADPTLGDVTLAGCSDQGPQVDTSVSFPSKPVPPDSVCDVETITGAGGAGRMDDLERDMLSFQALPNPSQQDGRTGSWSWYPQNVTVEIKKEGDNSVLHYAGSGLNAWTGVTLAFMGGNGAGTCYDASAYTGLRFKIKGSVTSSDTLANKVIVSLVTAETQTTKYGGDLEGEGGHFNKQVSLTSSFTTVEIPFAMFDKPTWGATATLTALAKGKLQAIDWGVTNTASAFDITIDDVELY